VIRSPVGPALNDLSDAAVHIWAASLDVPPERLATLAATLSDDERHRAVQFRRHWLSARYVAGRGQLRELLGGYLEVPPRVIEFAYDAHGRPRIARPNHHPSLHFNVTHSSSLALYAVSLISRVGIDVEEKRSFADMAPIARQNFSAAELRSLDAEPPADYVAAFYRCWTRKEAYLKATGNGLSTPLDSFDVSVAQRDPPALLRVEGDDGAPQRWAIVHQEPTSRFVGALAVETPHPDVHFWWRP
jgi:4'-phosphopantetheinyl transferase